MTPAQVNAAARHGASFAGGILTLLVVFGMLDPEQVKEIIAGLQQTMDGLSQATAGLAKVLYIVGPLMGVLGATYAAKSANFLNQLSSVLAALKQPNQDKAVDAKIAVLDAVAEQVPEVKKIVAPSLSNVTDSNKVVSQ